ncbi:unnamed protein product [marine sediment metagenome]|uniref:Uncharacterized protein n=1 Tax=marine sediment metagenome TaxID=412755 RepID=X1DBF4_9ZZZZ
MVMFNTENEGLLTVVKDYQESALKYLWRREEGDGASSREVWVNVNVDLMGKRTISRASVINFLNAMVDEEILTFHEITGKGGHRRIYAPAFDEAGTKMFLAKRILDKMLETWPQETKDAIASVTG